MDGWNRGKAFLLLSIFLFAGPLAGAWVSAYMSSHYEEQFRRAVVEQSKLVTAEEYAERGINYQQFCAGLRADTRERGAEDLCAPAAQITYVRYASLATLGVGVLLLALIFGGRALCGDDRKRLAAVFTPLVRAVLALLAISVLAQAALLIFTLYTVEVIRTQSVHYLFLGAFGFAAFVASSNLVEACFSYSKAPPAQLRVKPVTREEQPSLYAFADHVAQRVGVAPPDQIAVGLEPNFFVTESQIDYNEAEPLLEGRTLYVSLPLLRVLDEREAASVIGHELGHFRGEDALYSAKFAPTYARLGNSIQSLAERTGGIGDFVRFPAYAVVVACWTEFATVERKIARDREILADQAGVRAADAKSLSTALVKVALFGQIWPSVLAANVEELSKGRAITNLVSVFRSMSANLVSTVNWGQAQVVLGTTSQAHPVDTHPPLSQRLQALKMPIEGIDVTDVGLPSASASVLVTDVEQLEEELTATERRFLISSKIVTQPGAEDDD